MRKGLLIGIGTLGGLGAVLAITPPQFTNTKLIGGNTPAPQPATPTPTPTPAQTQAAATPAPTKATPKKTKKATTPSKTLQPPVATAIYTTSSGVSGTFTGGTFQNRFGPVQVQITVENGKITAAKALQYPNGDFRSSSISQQAIPYLVQETLQAQSANIQGVGGASYTSYGWYQSLQSALAKAGMK
jgi:uncharacterized protein with FMN-binding domain